MVSIKRAYNKQSYIRSQNSMKVQQEISLKDMLIPQLPKSDQPQKPITSKSLIAASVNNAKQKMANMMKINQKIVQGIQSVLKKNTRENNWRSSTGINQPFIRIAVSPNSKFMQAQNKQKQTAQIDLQSSFNFTNDSIHLQKHKSKNQEASNNKFTASHRMNFSQQITSNNEVSFQFQKRPAEIVPLEFKQIKRRVTLNNPTQTTQQSPTRKFSEMFKNILGEQQCQSPTFKKPSNPPQVPSPARAKYLTNLNRSMQIFGMLKKVQMTQKQTKQQPKIVENPELNKVINNFKLIQNLGKGKFGKVFLAKHIPSGFLVALKKVQKQVVMLHDLVLQFVKQIKIHASLDCPKIVKFYGHFQHEQSIYLILQYMNGGTLFRYLQKNGPLKPRQAAQLLKDVINGVIFIHERSIVHRDLKPQNIVISTEGVAKICDFGWATVVNSLRSTFCGTLDYASPQLLQKKAYDMSVDVWSIGVLAYELMMGKAPFEDPNKQKTKSLIINANKQKFEYSENVPKQAREFIQLVLQKDPQIRPRIDQLLSHQFFHKFLPKNIKKEQ